MTSTRRDDWRSAIRRTLRQGLLAGFAVVGSLPLARAEDWPQWRGPNSTGLSASPHSLPTEFSASSPNVRWSVEIGDGISSPCVAAGRVFSTSTGPAATATQAPEAATGDAEAATGDPGAATPEQPAADRFIVLGFDAASGQPLWRRDIPIEGEPLPKIHAVNSYASSTPAADADRVYVYHSRLGLMALDASTGQTVWQTQLPEPYFVFDWGPGSSPVIHGERIFFAQDDDLFPALVCLDKRSGEILWRDDRGDMACSYSHPVICDTPAGPEVVVAGTGKLIGYDYETGQRKWATDLFCRNIKTTPVSLDGVLYVSVESFGITYQWLATADVDGDGKITRQEVLQNQNRLNRDKPIPEAFWKKFERGDANGDGVLEADEIDRAFLDPSNRGGALADAVQSRLGGTKDVTKLTEELVELQKDASIQAVRGGGEGDVSQTHVLWQHKSKAPSHIVSPLVVDGRMFLLKQGGIASCFDIRAGEAIWERKRIGTAGGYLASPVHGDGKIYTTSDTGVVTVLESGPELKVLAQNDMGEATAATPAIADGRLFIRTRTRLFCIADEPAPTPR
jgi:outer membrane protein assembly factor BamB